MPIQRAASRVQVWLSRDYVCRSCRHELQTRHALPIRWQSNLSTSLADGSDESLSNIDHLNAAKSKPQHQSPIGHATLTADSKHGGDTHGRENSNSRSKDKGARHTGAASGKTSPVGLSKSRVSVAAKEPKQTTTASKSPTGVEHHMRVNTPARPNPQPSVQDGKSAGQGVAKHSKSTGRKSTSSRRKSARTGLLIRSLRAQVQKFIKQKLARALERRRTFRTVESEGRGKDGNSARKAWRSITPTEKVANQSKTPAATQQSVTDSAEHKALWEVMSRAKSSISNEATGSTSRDNAEQSKQQTKSDQKQTNLSGSETDDVHVVKPSELQVTPLNIPQPSVPGLAYGLDKVLFNPGVYQLQDPLSRVYNFDPYLQKIMPVTDFDFNALKDYKSSSQDTTLSALSKEHGKRYIGSTSSMTSTLAHFHYLLSDWRPITLNMLSRGFSDKLDTFTQLNRAPNSVFLRWKDGTYAIDADKEYDSGNVLMLLGKSMEKLLTMPTSEYERYRKSDPRTVSEEERTAPEAYEYTTMGDFLMRSQLDAHDPRLPGTGMFDLKTRAVVSVRMDAEDFQPMTGYEIYSLYGRFGSYEREFYDMIRSTMLKYMLQARMGRMNGIFVAYHNVERIFGFQYLPLQEMDRALHGQTDLCLGDQEFKTSLDLLNKVLDKATAKFPEQSLRFHFETATETLGAGGPTTVMWIFAEPMSEEEIEQIQATSKERVEDFERNMMGFEKEEIHEESEATSPLPTTSAAGHADSTTESAGLSGTNSQPTNEDASSASLSEYTSSDSNADSEFIESIAASIPTNRKPLFAASLICKSRVNGVARSRPEPLKDTDVWEVEYILREWDSPDAMWARYEQMKARRRDLFEKSSAEEDATNDNGEGNGSGELTSKQKRDRAFIEFLRSMSQRGREYRNEMDALDARKPVVVMGQPRTPSTTAIQSEVAGVEDYMEWLYSGHRL